MKLSNKTFSLLITLSIIVSIIICFTAPNEYYALSYAFILGGIFTGINIAQKRTIPLILSYIHILAPLIVMQVVFVAWPLFLHT
ncbi:hypothetical protein HCQ94_00230 [Actinomyces sp. zg-332]|uniref:hypothetical protein n=1 Tax=Actinomyces sp. zg-332 TaxID=2708340 RepID=UPI001422865D|nr:hypothetical protein [Actinomyces sp. zg-332]QPK94188.1 hypothetical protein HCQ94_00230 [Actinomyces sp. zg-332]